MPISHNDAATSRRGVSKEAKRNRGTNFVRAVGKLKELVGQLHRQQLQSNIVELGETWRSNPPAAPHFGEAHEVMVQADEKTIYAVAGHQDVTNEELITMFTGLESLLNFRPLTYQSLDRREDVPLTPNHFLHGQMGGTFSPESVETTTFHLRQRWRKVQDIIPRVWRRWLKRMCSCPQQHTKMNCET